MVFDIQDTAALESLKTNGLAEGKLIEFKSALPGRTDSDKIEFLADVSSFANTRGGQIIYGVIERDGVVTEIPGLTGVDPDAEVLRLESMMRDGIDPRIPGVSVRSIRTANGEPAIVLQLPNSWLGPHMVTFKQHSRFYARNSAGKYALDVGELREAFSASDSIGKRVREFREQRIAKIFGRETPAPLRQNAAVVLHILPFLGFSRNGMRDLVAEGAPIRELETFDGGFYNSWINFDGLIVGGAPNEAGELTAYSQLFRDGSTEIVGVLSDMSQERRIIPSLLLEERVISRTRGALAYLAARNIEPPIAVGLTMIGVQGLRMATGDFYHSREADRNVLIVPEVLFTGAEKVDSLLRPVLNSVWNAFGVAASPNYNEAGEWWNRR